MGAGGRELHDFNVVLRDDPAVDVVAFTDSRARAGRRRYPPALAGPRYPNGIPIRPEHELALLVEGEWADEVVLSYSELSAQSLLDKASAALAVGADVRLLGPNATMLASTKPVVAVCGAGGTATTRAVAALLRGGGCAVAVVAARPACGEPEVVRVRRYASAEDLDRARATLEERVEYGRLLADGLVVFAGADYEVVLGAAEAEADVLVWHGTTGDLPFVRPDVLVAVVDPLRAGHERGSHPGQAALRMADVVVVHRLEAADPAAVERLVDDVAALNPAAEFVELGTLTLADVLAPVVAGVAARASTDPRPVAGARSQ